jgi:hypothetical protein
VSGEKEEGEGRRGSRKKREVVGEVDHPAPLNFFRGNGVLVE